MTDPGAPWTGPSSAAPLIGRGAVLAAISEVLAERSVVLHGSMGVGKTALALAIGERQPSILVAGRPAETAAALGALAPLLESLGLGDARPIEVLARAPDALRTAHPGAVVIVDDAHHLDDLSAAVTLRLATAGVRVVATVRDGEPVVDAVASLWRDGVADRIEVPPLDPDGAAALAEAELGGPVEASAARRLHQLSEGRPLLLRELVRAGVVSGWLAEAEGRWRSGTGAPPPTARIDQLIGDRLEACPEPARAALEVLASVERLPLDVLLEVAGHDELVRLEAIDLIRVDSRTAAEGGTRTVIIGHPLVGEVVRARTEPDRQAAIADRLLDALVAASPEDMAASRDHVVRLGQLSLAGTRPDATLLARASRAAAATYRFDLALDLARAAAAVDGDVDARLLHGDAANAAGQWDEADAVLRSVLAEEGLTNAQQVEGLRLLASNLVWGMGRHEDGLAVLRDTDVGDRTELDAHLAGILLVLGQVAAALDLSERLLAEDLSPANRLRAAAANAGATMMSARPAAALAVIDEHLANGFALADEVPLALPELLGVQLLSHWVAGDLHAMEAGASNLLALGSAMDDTDQVGFWSMMLGMALQLRGRPASAIPHLDAALDRYAASDPGQLRGWAFALRGTAAALLGDRAAGRALLTRSVEPPYAGLGAYDHDRWTCRALATDGPPSAGAEVARTGAEEARARGGLSAEIILLDLATRLGDRTTAGRLAELHAASGEQSALGASAVALARGVQAGDAAALLADATTRAQMGADLAAAEVAAAAATAALAAGDPQLAFVAGHRSRSLLQRCEGATLRVPPPAGAAELLLSDRELEVAWLAATGATNAQIADRLHLSPRTVGNHLHRTYAKAAVEGRGDLAGVLARAGLLELASNG